MIFSEWGRSVLWEAYCDHDEQAFNPSGEEVVYEADGETYVEHYGYEDEEGWNECGQFGRIVGSWDLTAPVLTTPDVGQRVARQDWYDDGYDIVTMADYLTWDWSTP